MSIVWIVLGVMLFIHYGEGTYNCFTNNPCTEANIAETGRSFFPSDMDDRKYIECMERSGKPLCVLRSCGHPTRWNQAQQKCVDPSQPEAIVDMAEYNCFTNNPCSDEIMAINPNARFRSDLSYRFYIQCSLESPRCRIVSCPRFQEWNQREQQCVDRED